MAVAVSRRCLQSTSQADDPHRHPLFHKFIIKLIFVDMLLHKVFRAMERRREAKNNPRSDLEESDITSIMKIAGHYALNKITRDTAMDCFCDCFETLCKGLEEGAFQDYESGSEVGKKRKHSSSVPTIAPHRNLSWVDSGLQHLMRIPEFVILFFDGLGGIVFSHAVTVPTPFGPAEITTDDSIDAALRSLPKGYGRVLQRLQTNVWQQTALHLYYYSVDHGLGGPGSPARLAVDLLESQLSSFVAVSEKRIDYILETEGGAKQTLGCILTNDIMHSLGPFPVNLTYGPILRHIFYVEALFSNHLCMDMFLEHCQGDNGMRVGGVHRMGLLAVIGMFMLNNECPKQTNREGDLLCRSQIIDEFVWKIVPFPTLKTLVAIVVDEIEKCDDFVLIALSMASHLFVKHGNSIVSNENLTKIMEILTKDEIENRKVLDDDSYDDFVKNIGMALTNVEEASDIPLQLDNQNLLIDPQEDMSVGNAVDIKNELDDQQEDQEEGASSGCAVS